MTLPDDPIATEGALVALLASLAQAMRELPEYEPAQIADPMLLRDRVRYLVQGATVPAIGEPLTRQDQRVLLRLHALFEMMLTRPDSFLVDPRTIRDN